MFLKNGPNLEGSFLKSAKYYRAFLIFRKIFKSKLKSTEKTKLSSKGIASFSKTFGGFHFILSRLQIMSSIPFKMAFLLINTVILNKLQIT